MARWSHLAAAGVILLGAMLCVAARPAAADEYGAAAPPAALPAAPTPASDWSFGIDLTYASKYAWRGINTVNGSVFEPSVTLGYKGFALNVWGNMDLSEVNGHSGHFTELDYTLSYGWSTDDLTFGVGAIHYVFPHTGAPDTTELFGSVGLNNALAPTLTVYRDIDATHGTYATLGVSHTFPDVWKPSDGVSMGVALAGSVGFGSSKNNKFYFGVDHAAADNLLLTVGLPVQIGAHWRLTPSLNYSALLAHDIRGSMRRPDNLCPCLTLSRSF